MDLKKLLGGTLGKTANVISEIITGKKIFKEEEPVSTAQKIEQVRNEFAQKYPDLYKQKVGMSSLFLKQAENSKKMGRQFTSQLYSALGEYFLKTPTFGDENSTIYDEYYNKELNQKISDILFKSYSKKLSKKTDFTSGIILNTLASSYVKDTEDFAKLQKELFPQDPEANQDIFDRIALWANKNVVDLPNVGYDIIKGLARDIYSAPYNLLNAAGQATYVIHWGFSKLYETLGLKKQAQKEIEEGKFGFQLYEGLGERLGFKTIAQREEENLPYKTALGGALGEASGFFLLEGLPKAFNYIGKAGEALGLIKKAEEVGKVAEVAKGVEEAGKVEKEVKNLNIIQRVMRNLVPATRRSLGLYAQTQLLRPASEIEQQNKELQQGVFGVKKRVEKAAEDVAAFTAMEVALPIIGSGLKKVFAPVIDKFGGGGANLLRKQTEKIVNETVDANEKSVSQLVKTGKEQLNKVVKEEVPKQMLSGNISTSVAGMIYDKAPQEVKDFIEQKFPFLFPKNVPDKLGQATHDLLVSIHQGIENDNEDTIKASWDIFKKNIAKDGLFVKNEEEVFKKLVDYVNEGSSLAKEFLQTHTAQEGSLEANSLIKKLYPDISSKELSQMSKYAERILSKASDEQDIEKGFSKFIQKFELNEDELTSFFSKNNYTTKEDILSAFGGRTSTDYKVRLDDLKEQVNKLKVPEIEFTNAPETLTQGGIVGKLGLDKYTDVETLQRITKLPLDKEADFLTLESVHKAATEKYLTSLENAQKKMAEINNGSKKIIDVVEGEKGQKKFFVQDILDNVMNVIKTINITNPTKLYPTLIDRENELYKAAMEATEFDDFLRRVSKIKEEVKDAILKKEGIPDVGSYYMTVLNKKALEGGKRDILSEIFGGIMGGTGHQVGFGGQLSQKFREKLKVVTEFIPNVFDSVFKNYSETMSKIGDKYFAEGNFYKDLERIAKESGVKTNLELLDYIKNNPNLSSQFKDLASNHIITFESLRKFINDFNTFVGKKEISEIVGYVPHKMSDFLRESIESFYELYGGKELSATAKFTKERILKEMGVGDFFSDKPKEIIESYQRVFKGIVNRSLLDFSFERNIVSAKLPSSMAFVKGKLEQLFYGKKMTIRPSKLVAEMLKNFSITSKEVALSEEQINSIKSVIEKSQDPALKSALTDLISTPSIRDLNVLGKSLTVLTRAAETPFDLPFMMMKTLWFSLDFTPLALVKKIIPAAMQGYMPQDYIPAYAKGLGLWWKKFVGLATEDEKLLTEQLKLFRVISQDREVDTFAKKIMAPYFNALDEIGGYVAYFSSKNYMNNFEKNITSKEAKEFIEKHKELFTQLMSRMINITSGGVEAPTSKIGYVVNSTLAFRNFLLNMLGMLKGFGESFTSDEKARNFAYTFVSTMTGGTAPAELINEYYKLRFTSSGAAVKNILKFFIGIGAASSLYNTFAFLQKETFDFAYYAATGQNPTKLKGSEPNIYKGGEKTNPLHWVGAFAGVPYGLTLINDFYIPLGSAIKNFGEAVISGDTAGREQAINDIAETLDKGITPELMKKVVDVYYLSKYKEAPSREYQPSLKSFLEILSGQEPRPIQTQYSYEGNPLYALFGRSALPEYQTVEEGIKLQEDLKKDREDLKRAYLEQYNNPLNDEKKQQYERLKNKFEQKYNTTVEKKTIVNWLKGAEQTASERVLKTLPKGTKQQLRQKMSLEELLKVQ